MVRKLALACALCAVTSLMTAWRGGYADCALFDVVTPPAPTTGIVQGIVKRAAYFGATLIPKRRYTR